MTDAEIVGKINSILDEMSAINCKEGFSENYAKYQKLEKELEWAKHQACMRFYGIMSGMPNIPASAHFDVSANPGVKVWVLRAETAKDDWDD